MPLIDIVGNWIAGLGTAIGDLFSNIPKLLSSIVGLIPRGIVFIRSLFTPVYLYIEKLFGNGILSTIFGAGIIALLFYSCIGFLVALAFRRGAKT